MKIFLFRTALLFLFILLQLSFFDILFPWFRAPLFLLGVVVVFTLVQGFFGALFMTIPLTLLFDTASLGSISWFSLYALIFSYGTSFLSRRLLIEHRGLGLVLYALVAFGGALFYQALFLFVAYQNHASAERVYVSFVSSYERYWISLLFFLPLFIMTYFIVKRFEEYLNRIKQRRFLNIR